jgi:hypothetical protein
VKKVTWECLDACPTDVICQFFNCFWHFMNVYWKGLMGEAAAWVVQKQKSHQRVGQGAMMSIEAVLN